MTQPSDPASGSAAALLAGYLRAAGVRHAFGYPGESVIDVMEAVTGQGIAMVSAVREGTAAFMAEAAAMAGGRTEGRLNPSGVVTIAREAAPDGTILTTDVGSHKLMAGQGWQATEPRSVLIPNGLSAMGFGVPAAIAARLTRPDRPVLTATRLDGMDLAARSRPLIVEARIDPAQYETQF